MLSFWNTSVYSSRREVNSPMCPVFSVLKYAGLVEDKEKNIIGWTKKIQPQSTSESFRGFLVFSSQHLGLGVIFSILCLLGVCWASENCQFFLVFVFPPIMWKVWPLCILFLVPFSLSSSTLITCLSVHLIVLSIDVGYWGPVNFSIIFCFFLKWDEHFVFKVSDYFFCHFHSFC